MAEKTTAGTDDRSTEDQSAEHRVTEGQNTKDLSAEDQSAESQGADRQSTETTAGEVDFGRLPGVRFSALAFDVDTGERVFAHHADDELDTASMGKVFLLHTTLQMMVEGGSTSASSCSVGPRNASMNRASGTSWNRRA